MFQHEEDDVEWEEEEDILGEARPGTTKRKQYYAKKVKNEASFNPFILEFLKWILPSLDLDTFIVANRGVSQM